MGMYDRVGKNSIGITAGGEKDAVFRNYPKCTFNAENPYGGDSLDTFEVIVRGGIFLGLGTCFRQMSIFVLIQNGSKM